MLTSNDPAGLGALPRALADRLDGSAQLRRMPLGALGNRGLLSAHAYAPADPASGARRFQGAPIFLHAHFIPGVVEQ